MILEDTIKFRKSAKTPEDVAQWRLTYNFIIETKYFLERYDSIVETWDLCDKQFLMNLWNIEELMTSLLYKYTTVSTDYIKHSRLPKVEIKCCDHQFESSKDLYKHYYTVHHTPGRVNDVRFCEMKAGLLKLELYKNSLKYYLEFGTWCDHVLCLYLKKIYRKVNFTLDPFREGPGPIELANPAPPAEEQLPVEE
ncbi:uncharacterized protein LOC131284815 [Anopheles ziemanni]|uniref:uncharacterized protein LOC131261810 n=1 Tax=Anopheles coustani TaxID=139045 RepID=UPI00265AC110|nr:uncharacterized protein LOC131261810 [Anopheles coustani]XP_058169658.1 uncharacterized protein LOC131284815 [Anopheles ziemanni]